MWLIKQEFLKYFVSAENKPGQDTIRLDFPNGYTVYIDQFGTEFFLQLYYRTPTELITDNTAPFITNNYQRAIDWLKIIESL